MTQAALVREISALRDVLSEQIESLDQRLVRLRLEVDEVPSQIDERTSHIRSLFGEKFRTVSVKFREREARDKEQKRASDRALEAALKAAQDIVAEQNRSSAQSVAKSEANMNKQIEQLTTLMNTGMGALRDIVDDLKSRVGLIEGRSSGMSSGWGYIVGAIAMAGTIVMAFLAFSR